jgi:tRNA pseudouridine32 synthase / 23S rRNA pseudouridine746 synthase
MDKLHQFDKDISTIDSPYLFTYPFFYQAHRLAQLAALQVQSYLIDQQGLGHNFGLDPEDTTLVIGKMFGVLVVEKSNKEIAFLAAYSGKLANSNQHTYFVPPVFDMLSETGFFRQEEEVLNQLNAEILTLEKDESFLKLRQELIDLKKKTETEIGFKREELKQLKKERKAKRDLAITILSAQAYKKLEEELKEESLKQQYFFKLFCKDCQQKIALLTTQNSQKEENLSRLKEERKSRSNLLQRRLFDEYTFLNAKHESKSLLTIFEKELGIVPPAGAGECAAPKLLQYAFLQGLKPLAMAEFWWGQSPKSEIRKHKSFYPACRSKCEPILGFMLQGLLIEPNPMLTNVALGKKLETIYEDNDFLVVNKPAEFLSVPGKLVSDSVQTRVLQIYPEAILVHRLDQSTSGLLLIAKNKGIHQQLQALFLKRQVLKRYVALLVGKVDEKEGTIDLPLRVDLDNRPHQLVCYNYGKPAQTKYEVISTTQDETRIYFYPLTGRTHQLRVHAAHPLGLNCPIKGDDLYGEVASRLHLHAESLSFIHPKTKQKVLFFIEAPF